MGFGVFGKRGLDGRIGFGESSDFGEEAGVLKRVFAHAVGFGRLAKILIARELGNSASEFDYREAAEREACSTNTLRVNAGPEDWIGEKQIEKRAQVMGTLAPEDGARDGVVFQSVIAGMIYGSGDETV